MKMNQLITIAVFKFIYVHVNELTKDYHNSNIQIQTLTSVDKVRYFIQEKRLQDQGTKIIYEKFTKRWVKKSQSLWEKSGDSLVSALTAEVRHVSGTL